jgi:hypothetical protein
MRQLRPIHKSATRLDELEEDLLARRQRAISESSHGEVEGLELTLLPPSARHHRH